MTPEQERRFDAILSPGKQTEAEPACPTCGRPAHETCNCLKHHSPDVFGQPEYPE